MNQPTRNPKGQECKCCTCGRIFTSLTGFDRHWKQPDNEPRRCPTDAELVANRYTHKPDGTWQIIPTDSQMEALAKLKAKRSKNTPLEKV